MSPYKRLLKTASDDYLTKISQIAESDATLAFISSKAASIKSNMLADELGDKDHSEHSEHSERAQTW